MNTKVPSSKAENHQTKKGTATSQKQQRLVLWKELRGSKAVKF